MSRQKHRDKIYIIQLFKENCGTIESYWNRIEVCIDYRAAMNFFVKEENDLREYTMLSEFNPTYFSEHWDNSCALL